MRATPTCFTCDPQMCAAMCGGSTVQVFTVACSQDAAERLASRLRMIRVLAKKKRDDRGFGDQRHQSGAYVTAYALFVCLLCMGSAVLDAAYVECAELCTEGFEFSLFAMAGCAISGSFFSVEVGPRAMDVSDSGAVRKCRKTRISVCHCRCKRLRANGESFETSTTLLKKKKKRIRLAQNND